MLRALTLCLMLIGFGSVMLSDTRSLEADKGSSGTWQQLLKLQTTASVLHTTAHPDDEHGGTLAWLSRGVGVRVGLLTLSRGEAGDNALGSELFDGLGLIRTEELLAANRYYGVDHQYFTSVADYGYSKRVEEAWEKWSHEDLLREVVRVIRIDRPLVVVSRFQGGPRDGHGHHEAAGVITREAFEVAGDADRFPEQIEEGLRPWQPLKLYVGGVRAGEDWTVEVDPGRYSPWLGASYEAFARAGLSLQRSQNAGRLNIAPGPAPYRYMRVASRVPAPERESGFFDNIDTRIAGLFGALGKRAPKAAVERLARVEREVAEAVEAFSVADPSRAVPALAQGLGATRDAIAALEGEPDAQFMLRVKEAQFVDAINTALGIEFTAIAQPAGIDPAASLRGNSRPLEMGPVVAGQRFDVEGTLTNRGSVGIAPIEIGLLLPERWRVESEQHGWGTLGNNESAHTRWSVRVADAAPPSRPYYSRMSLVENAYTIDDPAEQYRARRTPLATAYARYAVNDVLVEAREVVRRVEAQLPYGYRMRELQLVPAVAVNVTPAHAVIPLAAQNHVLSIEVELLNNRNGGVNGTLAPRVPKPWRCRPASVDFEFRWAGERASFRFEVEVAAVNAAQYAIEVVASVDGTAFSEGYQVVAYRDLETRYLYRDATVYVHGVDVEVVDDLLVGYIMGIGDRVPEGIAQLGADVRLLGQADLGVGDLSRFDAIMIGTRAYAVRDDLRTYNQRLLDYVEEGGNLIVLYNTQEFVPEVYAPWPAELLRRAEEVSEEDAPVVILDAQHPVVRWPNRIDEMDFSGWVEQRGSKFLSRWDSAYTPILSTHDKEQAPQRGGWLSTRYGKGHYTYFAYALHRQLAYGVAGAYRLLANLLSQGRMN